MRICSLVLVALYGASFGGFPRAQQPLERGERLAVPGTGAVVRVEQGVPGRAAVSRDGERSWSALPDVDHDVHLRGAAFDLAAAPALPPALLAPPDARLFLVQFETDVIPEYVRALAQRGAEVVWYVPQQTYLVRMPPGIAADVAAQPYVRAVADYHVGYRLAPDVLADLAAGGAQTRAYEVLLTRRTEAAAVERAIEAAGGTLAQRARGGIRLTARLSAAQLMQIAGHDGVVFVERRTAIGHDLELARLATGAAYLESVAGIDGKGIRGHLFEGIDPTHPELAARPPYRQAPIELLSGTPSEHGSQLAGVMFAQGLQMKGFLPFGQLIYTAFAGVDRFEMTRQLVEPTGPYRGMFETAAWGNSPTTQYTSVSADLDDILFQFDVFCTNSQGNTANRTSRPQAWAKNCAGVGGFMSFNNLNPADDCWCFTSSTGPAADGRVGVAFVAPYDNVTTTGTAGSYTSSFGGTSASTAIVAGVAGLAMQVFGDGYLGYPAVPWQMRFESRPHATTTRVMLAVTSRQLPYAQASRYEQGWGFPNVQDLYDLRDSILVLDEEDVLRQGQTRTYWLFVAPSTPELRVSMQHLDPPALPLAMPTRVNSVDLRATAPDGTVYWGNDAGLLSGPYSSGGGAPNDIDLHENIFVQAPAPGIWQVSVRASAVRLDAHLETPEMDVDFALAVRGISGGRARSGMTLDLTSAQPGELELSLQALPAGWQLGYTLLSAATQRHPSLGNLLGVEADALALTSFAVPPSAGNPFAFVASAVPSAYPNAAFRFPAAVAAALRGVTLDGVALVLDGTGRIAAVSNVSRVTVQ